MPKNGRRGQMLRAAVFLCGMFLASAVPAFAENSTYVLALFWQPGICFSVRGAEKGECRPNGTAQLALHGLWPNADRNGDGRQDADDDYCLPPAERARVIALDKAQWDFPKLPPVPLSDDLRADLARAMRGMSHLDRHEWWKHGTCSGFDAERYFAAAVALTDAVGETYLGKLIVDHAGQDVARRDLLQAFSKEFGQGSERALQLLCRKDGADFYLSEIRLRLRVEAVEAPLSAQSLDTARAIKGSCPARFWVT
jgi:ribonuclease T2